jgi:hypothetical protein
MSNTTDYPGYETFNGTEITDFPFHGNGRKSIRHKLPTPEGYLEISVYWYESPGGEEQETVNVNTYHNEGEPNTNFKLEHMKIIDGWFGDRAPFE